MAQLPIDNSFQNSTVDDVINGEDEDSPRQMYRKLLRCVMNETTAPELLTYEETIVEGIAEQIEHMNASLIKHRDKFEKFYVEQHELELERFRYILCKYHRTRIEKIERLVLILLTRQGGCGIAARDTGSREGGVPS